MLRMFNGTRKIIFFPRSWANSVTRWMQTLGSKSGTIKVTQSSPDGEGASLDIDVEKVVSLAAPALAGRFVARFEKSGVDGESVEIDGSGKVRINTEWLDKFIRQRVNANSLV